MMKSRTERGRIRKKKTGATKQSRLEGKKKRRKERRKDGKTGTEDRKEREDERARQSLHALVQVRVSMVTSAGYQKIEAPSVCLHSALPLPIRKHHLSHDTAHNFIPALYYAVCLAGAPCASNSSKNLFKNTV